MYKIIIIDDHQMLRDMIAETLNSNEKYSVVATAGDAKDSIELCEQYKPDLLLMDICTENNSNGIAYAKKIKIIYPKVKIIIMTGVLDLNFINDAKKANIDSFIYKNISKESLIMAISNTLNGYSIYPNEKSNNDILEKNILSTLSDTELKILTLYCKILDRDKVAEQMKMSLRTLKNHISSIYDKTGYNNLAKLAVYCVANGLIVPNLESPNE